LEDVTRNRSCISLPLLKDIRMKKIKILQMPISNTGRGLTKYVLENWRFIDKTRYQFDFVTLSKSLDFEKDLLEQGCKIHYLTCSSMENEKQFTKEMKQILEENYNAIHLHTSYWNGFLVEKLAKEHGCPKIIVHSHSTLVDISDEHLRNRLIAEHNQYKELFSTDYATHFCACSWQAADWLFGDQIPRDQIRILNNAIDVDMYNYNELIRKQYRDDMKIEDCFVMGHVGKFTYLKNHSFLIEVFKKVSSILPKARLMLIGDGPLEEEIHQMAVDYGLVDKILFLGKRNDVPNLLQAMDVFLLPSKFEGLGLVLIEAQASGLTCIASDCLPLESKITPNVHYLDSKLDLWMKEILKYSKNINRTNNIEQIKEQGYSIKNEVKILEKLYSSK
jgi:glycosyltransferase involved in cell wall biosynthesis